MQEQLSRYKPGDKVPVTYVRDERETIVVVTFKNNAGNYDLVKVDAIIDGLGGEFLALDSKKAKELGISGGVVVKNK